MKKEIIYKERLLKLVDHLENGKLGHKKFDFRFWNSSKGCIPMYNSECGYMGCAIGECPIAFPNEWIFLRGIPVLDTRETMYSSYGSGMTFFGLDREEFVHLFKPNEQKVSIYGGKFLNNDATKEQVAQNIRDFVIKRFPK